MALCIWQEEYQERNLLQSGSTQARLVVALCILQEEYQERNVEVGGLWNDYGACQLEYYYMRP